MLTAWRALALQQKADVTAGLDASRKIQGQTAPSKHQLLLSWKFCIISCCPRWHLTFPKRGVQSRLSWWHPKCTESDWAAPAPLAHSQAGKEGSVGDCPAQSKHRGFWRDADLKTASAQPLECAKPSVSAWDIQHSYLNNTRRFCSQN